MKPLEYPFDAETILKKKKSLKRQLLEENSPRMEKRIAILGGSTTREVKNILELFLLHHGIAPVFYESEYNMYWQDVMFEASELVAFCPDIIYIHTTSRNVGRYPAMSDPPERVAALLEETYNHFEGMWKKIEQTFCCPVIQNNFEPLFYRLMGNRDIWDMHGKNHFLQELNSRFYEYARNHKHFYIQDIQYMAACYGLQKWADPFYWHMYKYGLAVPAIPELAYNLANIIKSIYGKNKKALVLDLDNTLWGGIVGDDGPENIEIGQETSMGQLYSEFQAYIKAHKEFGIVLAVNSKNEEENALAGLNRPDSVLRPEDFVVIKANWNPKDRNMVEIADTLNIGRDSLVFVDDNPAERQIVADQLPEVAVPPMEAPEKYMIQLDRCGFFEVTELSEDDLKRTEMYRENARRKELQAAFSDYRDYLLSLDMQAQIGPFCPVYMSRIAQLTNKSNQFNLTTRRCTQAEIESFAADDSYITCYGKLQDKFGDNGVVSVVFGHVDEAEDTVFHIDLWLMSCRVLKRDMEFAMMDYLAEQCLQRGIREIYGYYYPTAKNRMVREFYKDQGFERIMTKEDQSTIWRFPLDADYHNKNTVIRVNGQSL